MLEGGGVGSTLTLTASPRIRNSALLAAQVGIRKTIRSLQAVIFRCGRREEAAQVSPLQASQRWYHSLDPWSMDCSSGTDGACARFTNVLLVSMEAEALRPRLRGVPKNWFV